MANLQGVLGLCVCMALTVNVTQAQRIFPLGVSVDDYYVERIGYIDAVGATTNLYHPVFRTMAPSIAQLQGEVPTTGATITNPTNLIYLVSRGLKTDIIGPRPGGILSITGCVIQAASVQAPTGMYTGAVTSPDFILSSTNSWDDLRFPPQSVNIVGGIASCELIGTWGPDNNQLAMAFDRAKTECMYIMAQMPHTYAVNSRILPHLHLSPNTTATGSVVFVVSYTWANMGQTFPSEKALTNVVTIASNSQWKHMMVNMGAIYPTAVQGGISSMLQMRVSRLGGDVRDTYPNDMHLLEFDIHYLSRGAPEPYIP